MIAVLATALLMTANVLPAAAQSSPTATQSGSVANAPQVRVSRKEMSLDETLSLEITLKRGGTPLLETKTLEEDFEIIGRSTSTRTEIVNGRAAIETTLSLMLSPRRAGRLTIPAFDIDNATTSPMLVTVKDGPQSAPESARLVAEIVPSLERAFINEQLILTLRITYAEQVGRLNGDPLTIDGADISEPVAERRFQRGTGVNRRNVIEIDYALFPKEAGEIVIAPRNYGGIIAVTPSKDNNFQRGQRILSRTDRVRIEVVDPAKDPIASQQSPWLPASSISTSTEWSTDPAKLQVGEPVTRTVTIQTRGQRAAAIPPLTPIESADIKQYSEQPTLSDSQNDSGVVGTRVQTSAFVPVKAGEIVLPEQRFHWFDTADRTWREVIIPAVTLTVLASSSSIQEVAQLPDPGAVGNSGASMTATGMVRDSITRHSSLTAVLGGTTLLFALSSLLLWQRLGRLENSHLPTRAEERATSVDADAAWRDVQTALQAKHPHNIREKLLRWARASEPATKSLSLDSLAAKLDDDVAADALRALDASLYSHAAQPTDFVRLGRALESLRNAPVAAGRLASDTAALPALYRS